MARKRIPPHRLLMMQALEEAMKGNVAASRRTLAQGRELLDKFYSREQKKG